MSADGDRRQRRRIIAGFAAIYLFWGSTFLAIRIAVQDLPPFLFSASRFLFAGVLLAMIGAYLGERFPRTAREWRYLLLFSVLMVTLSNGGTVWALRHLPSNEAALLTTASALWIAWLGTYGPRGHRLTPMSIAGLLLGLVGVALLIWPSDTRATGDLRWHALILFSTFCWASGTIIFRNAALPFGPVAFNAAMMLLGGTWLALLGIADRELPQWHWSAPGVIAIVYLAVFGSALAYTAYAWLLKHVSAHKVGTFAYVNPAIATLLGWVVLDERLTPPQLAGMFVVLVGVALVTLPGQKPRRREPSLNDET